MTGKWILTRGGLIAKGYKARKIERSQKTAALIESRYGRHVKHSGLINKYRSENMCWQKSSSSSRIRGYSQVFQSEIRGVDDVFEQ